MPHDAKSILTHACLFVFMCSGNCSKIDRAGEQYIKLRLGLIKTVVMKVFEKSYLCIAFVYLSR